MTNAVIELEKMQNGSLFITDKLKYVSMIAIVTTDSSSSKKYRKYYTFKKMTYSNAKKISGSYLGYSDWRIPNLNEMQELFENHDEIFGVKDYNAMICCNFWVSDMVFIENHHTALRCYNDDYSHYYQCSEKEKCHTILIR